MTPLLPFRHQTVVAFFILELCEKNTAERIVVVMVSGMTDENGWQEIHQVTHTRRRTDAHTSIHLNTLPI